MKAADLTPAREALARHDRGRCNVKLDDYDNDAGTGHCARSAGHEAGVYDEGHSGWPDDEDWADHLRATMAEVDRLSAALAALEPCVPSRAARDVLRHIATVQLAVVAHGPGTDAELDARDAWADAEHDWRKEGYAVPAEPTP